MHVVGDVSLCASEDGRFEARGGVQAVGIRVDGLFNGNGGRFVSIHAQRSALTLESATIGGALFIRRGDGFRAEALGEVKAFGATIGGNVECSGAKLVNRRGNALWMEGAEVGGSLLLRQVDRNPFIAIGEVNLRNLKVAGSAAFDGTFSCHGTSDALDLESTHIGTLRVRLSPQSKGVVSLAGAQVDELDDFGGYGWGPEPLPNVRGTGPVGVMLKLDGFNYRRLGPWRPPRAQGLQRLGWPIRRAFGFSTPRDRWWHRVQWLERQYVGSKPVADDFFPQPHEQLAKVLHLMGHDYDARRIMTHRFAHESRCRANEFVSRFFMRLYRWGFGCGYLPIRAFTTVVLWLLIGWGGVTCALHLNHAGNVIFVRATTPVDIVRTLSKPDDAPTSSARSEPYPEFKTRDIACDEVSPVLYALDTMLPVFQLHMESKCEFTDNTRSGRIGRHVKGVFSLLGWIIVTLAALTWTGVLRREPA
jgi:hypothetical protein